VPCGEDYWGPSKYEDLLKKAHQEDLLKKGSTSQSVQAASRPQPAAQNIRDVAARVNQAAGVQPAQSVASSARSKNQRRSARSKYEQLDLRSRNIMCGTAHADNREGAEPGAMQTVLCSICQDRGNEAGCKNAAFPRGYEQRMEEDLRFRQQQHQMGCGMTLANFVISPAEAVQLLGAMGVVATLESIGTGQGTRPDEPSDFMTSPFYVHLVMLVMGMLLGMLVRDCTREIIPYVRRVFRAYFRRVQVQHRQQRPGDNLERFVVNTERRLDNLEIRMDASARREYTTEIAKQTQTLA
jgi:hypothetical protein